MKKPTFSRNDVELIETRENYSGFFNLNTLKLRHRKFDGSWMEPIEREVFERGHAVSVIPYDPETDQVILIEQFRPGAYAALNSPWFQGDSSPWLYEAVAGIIDPGEKPEEVAYREAIEETGCALTDILPICHYLVSPGGTSETVFVFAGRANSEDVGGLHGVAHEGEDIRPFAIGLEKAHAAIANGTINNGVTIIAIQWLMLHRETVIKNWT